jgi:hypothetical protein
MQYCRDHGYNEKEYCVTEKIHGTNYSFIVNHGVLEHASRDGILGGTANLFNSKNFSQDIEKKILALAQHIGKKIQIVTEFYGKGIVNKSVIPYITLNGLDKDFIAYEMLIDDEFINYEQAIEYFKMFDIPYVPISFKGTLDECLKFKIEKSMLCDSSPEGMVIKPMDVLYTEGDQRVIFKDVYSGFQETHNKQSINKHIQDKKDEANKVTEYIQHIQDRLTDVRIDKFVARLGINCTVTEDKEQNNTVIKAILIPVADDIKEEIQNELKLDIHINLVRQETVKAVKRYLGL